MAGNREVLSDDWRNELAFRLDGEFRAGQLFAWKPDLLKFFPGIPEPAPKAAPKPKVSESKGGMFKPGWLWCAAEVLRIHHQNPRDEAGAIFKKLEARFEDLNEKAPADSHLIELIKQVVSYYDHPQRPPRKKGETG